MSGIDRNLAIPQDASWIGISVVNVTGTIDAEPTNNRSFSNGAVGNKPTGSVLSQSFSVAANATGFVSVLIPSLILDAKKPCHSISLKNGSKIVIAWDASERSQSGASKIILSNWEVLSGTSIEIIRHEIDAVNFYSMASINAVELGKSVLKTIINLSDGRTIVGILNINVCEC
jgi:hypothetical protein